jgi:hypothetical protein
MLKLASANTTAPRKPKRVWLASKDGVQREFPTRKQAEAYAFSR